MMEGLLTFIITTTKETTQTKGGKVQIDKNKQLLYDTVSDVVESEVHQCQQNSDA